MLQLFFLLLLANYSFAAAIKRLICFGDSYVDDNASNFSNWARLTWPKSPPFLYRWSNGPTFAGHLARQLNVSCDFSNENTTAGVRCDNYINVASGGSCSLAYPSTMMSMTSYCQSNGTFSPPFFPDQLDNAKKIASNYTADDLLLISIGGNDLNGLLNANDGFIDKIGDVLGSGHAVADTIMKGVRRLYDEGARNFALVNVPAVVLTPRALSSIGTSGVKFEVADEFLENFGRYYYSLVEKARNELKGVTIHFLNLNGCMRELNVNKYGGYKGFTTLDKPCVTDRFEANVTICLSAQQQQYLYYDDIHPTTAHHALLAKLMAEALASPSDTSLCMSSACLGDSILDRCFESLAANVVVAWGSLIALLAVVAM